MLLLRDDLIPVIRGRKRVWGRVRDGKDDEARAPSSEENGEVSKLRIDVALLVFSGSSRFY